LSQQGEIWQRANNGQFYHTRLFYQEKAALEFYPGDLAALGNAPSWQRLSALIDPNSLGKTLALTGKEENEGVWVEHYQGIIKAQAVEVDWLPNLKLPARLSRQDPEGKVVLTLNTCGKPSELPVQPISKTELDNWRHLDFTDLGDMENDPQVRRLEQLMGGHHHH
jgi:hypothetical protein